MKISNVRKAYVAPVHYLDMLLAELGDEQDLLCMERLILDSNSDRFPVWAENVWLEPQVISIDSIKDGARKLRSIQRNWVLYSVGNHRRANLIQEQLPHVSAKPLVFGEPLPKSPLGSWTLIDKNTILASAKCSSPVPNGAFRFVENKIDPPNRAYLKLWEALTRLEMFPQSGQLCLDLGSSPGGWSWVAAQCGAHVYSIDKAPLDERISRHPNIEHCLGSGFALDPRHCGQLDWLFSDMACYPDRLFKLLTRWLEQGECRNYICTVKLQGEDDWKSIRDLQSIPGSQIVHLSHNKHELTWILTGNE